MREFIICASEFLIFNLKDHTKRANNKNYFAIIRAVNRFIQTSQTALWGMQCFLIYIYKKNFTLRNFF